MFTKRFLIAVFALALLLPLTGCNGCRRNCSNSSGSFAPPPAPCCIGSAQPGY